MDIAALWPRSRQVKIIFDNSVIKHKFESRAIKGYLLGDSEYKVKPYHIYPQMNHSTQSKS